MVGYFGISFGMYTLLLISSFFFQGLFCQASGEGSPVVVVHGGPGLSQDYLLPQMEKLSDHHKVIFYDQRGCGRSAGESEDTPITMKTYLDDLDALISQLGKEKVSLVGHSWGGYIAMRYALEHPEKVDKLVLSNSMPACSQDLQLLFDNFVKLMAPDLMKLDEIKNSNAFKAGDPEVHKAYYRLFFSKYFHNPDMIEQLNLPFTADSALKSISTGDTLRNEVFFTPYDYRSQLGALSMPALIIHGVSDVIPEAVSETFYHSIPDSKLVVMPECGHFPYIEKPKSYFEILEDFLLS